MRHVLEWSNGEAAQQDERSRPVCWQGPLACLAYMADPQQRPTSLRPAAPCVWSAADLAAALQAAALPVARDAATGHCVRTPLRPSGWVRLLCRSHYEPQRAVQLGALAARGRADRLRGRARARAARWQPQDSRRAAASSEREHAQGAGTRHSSRPVCAGWPAALAPLPHLAARHRAKRAGPDGVPQHRVIHHLSWPRGVNSR